VKLTFEKLVDAGCAGPQVLEKGGDIRRLGFSMRYWGSVVESSKKNSIHADERSKGELRSHPIAKKRITSQEKSEEKEYLR